MFESGVRAGRRRAGWCGTVVAASIGEFVSRWFLGRDRRASRRLGLGRTVERATARLPTRETCEASKLVK